MLLNKESHLRGGVVFNDLCVLDGVFRQATRWFRRTSHCICLLKNVKKFFFETRGVYRVQNESEQPQQLDAVKASRLYLIFQPFYWPHIDYSAKGCLPWNDHLFPSSAVSDNEISSLWYWTCWMEIINSPSGQVSHCFSSCPCFNQLCRAINCACAQDHTLAPRELSNLPKEISFTDFRGDLRH